MDSSEHNGFTNQVIVPESIPDCADVPFQHVAPAFRRYVLISTVLYVLPLMVGAAVFVLGPFGSAGVAPAVAGAGLVALMALIGVYRWLDAGYRGWALREHDLIARAGVWWRAVIALPIARIQHVETTHGPLERAHGLAQLKLYTAGGMTADLIVIGLDRETADELREHLIEQIRKRDAEAGQYANE